MGGLLWDPTLGRRDLEFPDFLDLPRTLDLGPDVFPVF